VSGTPTSPSGSDATWVYTLATLVALRVLIPLLVLAAAPARVPLLPEYSYTPLNGDSARFYQGAVNLLATTDGVLVGWIGLAAVAMTIMFGAASVLLWRADVRWLAVLLPALALSLILGVLVDKMASPSAPVIGWPIVWAFSLLPLHLFHIELTPDRAFPLGLGLSLIANATIVVATAMIGLRATGRRSIGLIAAGLYATFPLWVAVVAGAQAWENGQWRVDVGLHLYDEPVSTALVAVALAILLHPRLSTTSAAVAGLLLGFSTAVKLTNGPLAVALVVVVAFGSGARRAAVLALGGMVSLPIVVGFWSKGYADDSGGQALDLGALYQLRFISTNARTSTIFTMWMLLLLLPLAALGVMTLTGWYRRAVLLVPILATIACYASYYVTNQHPRFYYVILPAVFVLQAAGAILIWDAGRRLRPRVRAVSDTSA
jgi:hypothetical protein